MELPRRVAVFIVTFAKNVKIVDLEGRGAGFKDRFRDSGRKGQKQTGVGVFFDQPRDGFVTPGNENVAVGHGQPVPVFQQSAHILILCYTNCYPALFELG